QPRPHGIRRALLAEAQRVALSLSRSAPAEARPSPPASARPAAVPSLCPAKPAWRPRNANQSPHHNKRPENRRLTLLNHDVSVRPHAGPAGKLRLANIGGVESSHG